VDHNAGRKVRDRERYANMSREKKDEKNKKEPERQMKKAAAIGKQLGQLSWNFE
jgi:hypothetical protein